MTRWFLVSMLTLVCLPGWALRTGDIQTQSRLNEPLEAVLSISDVSAVDAANLQVRVASADIYAQLGLERSVAANDLRFAIEGEAPDSLRIRVRGQRPWVEPYAILVLDIATSSGRLLREYTLLLDPAQAAPAPLLVAEQPVEPERTVAQSEAQAAEPAANQGGVTAPVAPARPAPDAAPASRSVDTAADRRTAVPEPAVTGLTPAQAVAGNSPIVDTADGRRIPTPAGGNQPIVRGTQPGEVLRVRPGANLFAIASDIAQSRDIGVSQVAWALYQDNPKAFAGSPDQLLRGARLGVPSDAQMRSTTESQAKKLLQQGRRTPAAGTPITPPPRASVRSEPRPVVTPIVTQVAQATPTPVPQLSADPSLAESTAEPAVERPAEDTFAQEEDEVSTASDDLLEESFLDESADAAGAPATQQSSPSIFEKLPVWGWLAGAAVVLLLLLLLLRRRRADEDDDDMVPMAATADGVGQARPMDDAFAAQGRSAQAEDEAGSLESISLDAAPLTDTADESLSDLDDQAPADPIAEADFHIAYGLYDEAERVLSQARDAEPDRDDLIEKLAETYFASGNTQAFEALAREVQQTRPQSSAWGRIREWGAQLLPGAALFAAAAGSESAEELGALELPDADAATTESFAEPEVVESSMDVGGADASQEQGSSVATDVVPEHEQADLGGDQTTSEAPTEGLAEAEPTQFTEPAVDDNVVEFELPEPPSEQQLADPEQPDAGNVIDFDLPADVSEDAADESAPPPEVADSDADFSLAVDQDSTSEDDDLEQISITDLEADAAPDFDLAEATDDSPDSTAWAADQGSDSSLEDVEFALDDLQPASDADQDFDLELESGDSTDPVGGEGSEDLELSLDEFDLSDSAISDDEGLATDVDADANQAGGENNVVNHDDVVSTGDDMAGKLDLARAYIDMSELDMARSLLDEVALRGSDEQRAEAQTMLEQLG